MDINLISIRQIIHSDIDDVLEILNYNILNSTNKYFDKTITKDQLLLWLDKKRINNFPIIVIIWNKINKVIGFATYSKYREYSGFKHSMEHSIYINNDCKKKGYGTLLMNELIKIAKENKIHTLIGCIDSSNIDSINFHKKFNFDKIGVLKEIGYKYEKWLDMVIMQLIL